MTGQGPFVQLPQTIPAFQPVLPLYIPQDVDVTAIKAQVADVGVSAPPAAMPGLVDVVNQAHAEVRLQILQATTQRGLRNAEGGGGPIEGAILGNGDKGLHTERIYFHAEYALIM